MPWPPSPDATPALSACESQRPGLNAAPAVSQDSATVYVVARAHLNSQYAYLVAVAASDLATRWTASLRGHLEDGCNVLLPPSGTVGGCRAGSRRGVDPATNDKPAGRVLDQSTSSVVAPDGSILYGAFTRYNNSRGHMMRFAAADGAFLAAYPFGWDITPAIWEHDGAWSAILKDNHYPGGTYCGDARYCGNEEGRYGITRLTPDLTPEWTFENENEQACARRPDGSIVCQKANEKLNGASTWWPWTATATSSPTARTATSTRSTHPAKSRPRYF